MFKRSFEKDTDKVYIRMNFTHLLMWTSRAMLEEIISWFISPP